MLNMIIADDEVWVAHMIANLIDWEAEGFAVAAICYNGVETLEQIRKIRPELVLTDIKMPGMSGLDLIAQAQAEGIDSQFVIISGYNDFAYAKAALGYRVAAYLLKPLDEKELKGVVAHVRSLIRQSREQEQDKERMRSEHIRMRQQARRRFYMDLLRYSEDMISDASAQENDFYRELTGDAFLVAAVSVQESEIDELCTAWDALLSTHLRDAFKYGDRTGPRQVTALFNFRAEGAETVHRKIREAFEELLKKESEGVYLGFGSVVGSLAEVSRSYRMAELALSYRWVLPEKHSFEIEGVWEEKAALASICSMNTELKLRAALNEGNASRTERIADEVLQQALRWSQKQPQVLFQSIQWLLTLFEDILLRQMEINPEIERALRKARERITNARDVAEVREEIGKYIRQLIAMRSEGASASKSELLIQSALAYIDQNYMQDIGLNDVAEAVHLNPNYFCSLFKERTHTTFKRYLTRRRIEIAKDYLKSDKYHLYEVADMVGYNDVKQFSYMFKKVVGITPSEYRRVILGYE